MNERIVRLSGVELGDIEVSRTIESPTPGVVIIDAHVTGRSVPSPLHWRVGTWRKPPLDISLDDTGRFLAAQFVLQDEGVAEMPSAPRPEPLAGIPVFDVANWPKDRYLDEDCPVTAGRWQEELIVRIREDDAGPNRSYRIGADLEMGFCSEGRLTEVRFGPLSPDDWEVIAAFSQAFP